MTHYKLNMETENIDIKNILKDIEQGELSINQIIQKYNITRYKYNQIIKIADIKKPYVQTADNSNKKKPKVTKFKKMLAESVIDTNDQLFNIESFKSDCKNSMKISELMEKYSLSLYQVRELRKKHELTTK